MTSDLDPWRRLADAQEQSAFRAWAAALTSAGRSTTLLGTPDSERDRYAHRFGIPPEVLTVDAHVALDGQEVYFDHTAMAVGSLPAAIREASETLNHELAGAVLLSPTGGLRLTVVPQTGTSKERRRYYARLVSYGHRAARTGRSVPDPDAAPDDPFPYPVAEPWPPRSPEQPVELTIAQPLSWRLRHTPTSWDHDTARVRELLGASLVKKLTASKTNGRPGQLARAAALGLRTGLLIDARVGWQPPGPRVPGRPPRRPPPAVIDLPTGLVADLLAELTAEHPRTLSLAWLLGTDGHVHQIFPLLP